MAAVLVLALKASPAAAQSIRGNPVVLDSRGLLLAGHPPQQTAFSRTALTAWQFLAGLPNGANGLPIYRTYPGLDSLAPYQWLHNPASLHAMLTESGLALYAFTGDPSIPALVQAGLDYHLAHGMTAGTGSWASVPFASSNPGDTDYQGADDVWACEGSPCGRGDGPGVLEPDKVGELGLAFLLYFQWSGRPVYLTAAIACADALARNLRTGDELHSPWPFRVHAADGRVREEYTASLIKPIALFDQLGRLGMGDTAGYLHARAVAWDWLLAFPMRNGNWSAYFEDVPIVEPPGANRNQYSPLETARYLLLHPELDPEWRAHAQSLIRLVEQVFGGDTATEAGVQWGATTISEQEGYPLKMGSHTARYASVKALWFERTGEVSAREAAFRSFNWATYVNDGNGLVGADVTAGSAVWFSDGYGDYVRHFLAGLASVPDWAPPGENHLLRSSSVVRRVVYSATAVSYETFDQDAAEVLRVNAPPTAVLAHGQPLLCGAASGGYSFRPLGGGDYSLSVHHQAATDVVVRLGAAGTPARCQAQSTSGCSTTHGEPFPVWGPPVILLLARRRRPGPVPGADTPGRLDRRTTTSS